MRKVLAVLAVFALALPVWAADDGNTQPKLNSATVNWSVTSNDIVSTTNGSGNVKGVFCTFLYNTSPVTVKFYVNGGSAQSIVVEPDEMDSNSIYHSGLIPLNVRFTSSIRIQMVGSSGGPEITCKASWALD